MQTPSYIALSRQTALWRQMDVVANNLANMNTPGYKTEDMVFSAYLTRSRDEDGGVPDTLAYTYDFGTVRDMDPGPMTPTGNPLDLAINGKGFFEVETDFGRFYTRNGRLMLNQDGMVVTSSGHPVLSTDGTPFFIAPNESDINVARDGSIATENGVIGRLRIATFENERELRRVQAGLFDAGDQTPQDPDSVVIEQGALEGSNVVATREITHMIAVHRAYESVNRLIETESERQRQAIKILTGAQV